MITSRTECGVELLIHSQTSTVQPLKYGDGYVILSHNILGIWLIIHAGIKVKLC